MTVRTAKEIKDHISYLQRDMDNHATEYHKAKVRGDDYAMAWHSEGYKHKKNWIAQLINQLGPKKVEEEIGYDDLSNVGKGAFHQRFYEYWARRRARNWGKSSDEDNENTKEMEYHGVKAWNFKNPLKPIKKLNDIEKYLEENYGYDKLDVLGKANFHHRAAQQHEVNYHHARTPQDKKDIDNEYQYHIKKRNALLQIWKSGVKDF